jgi:hypothetical protein
MIRHACSPTIAVRRQFTAAGAVLHCVRDNARIMRCRSHESPPSIRAHETSCASNAVEKCDDAAARRHAAIA